MKVGEWRWVAGQGLMEIVELAAPPKKISVTCRTPQGITYWAGVDQVRGIPKIEDVLFNEKQLKSRNLSTEGFERIYHWLRAEG
jgi:hypothetical protein